MGRKRKMSVLIQRNDLERMIDWNPALKQLPNWTKLGQILQANWRSIDKLYSEVETLKLTIVTS